MRIAVVVFGGLLALPIRADAASDEVYEGIYIFGPEVETFSPCSIGNTTWWVLTSEQIWLQLREDTLRFASESYGGIFVRVVGHYAGPPDEDVSGAFSTEYDGLFRISEVLAVSPREQAGCDPVTRSSN